jgi:hypothetical protein
MDSLSEICVVPGQRWHENRKLLPTQSGFLEIFLTRMCVIEWVLYEAVAIGALQHRCRKLGHKEIVRYEVFG